MSKPSGSFQSSNVGIKSILAPPKPKTIHASDQALVDSENETSEMFTVEQMEYAWKEYALKVKREKKNSLFSTLNGSNPRVASDYSITIDLKNDIEAGDIDREKPELLGFLRHKLNNKKISLKYQIMESQKTGFVDNKSVFENLCKENDSLNKFRKMFNLDIEF